MGKLDQLRAMREARPDSRGGGESEPIRKPTLHRDGVAAVNLGNRTSRESATEPVAGVAPGPRESRKTGRPRLEDRDKTLEATEPWAAAGMSRTTWFRRQAEQRAKAKQE
jgi:hypothetical protein